MPKQLYIPLPCAAARAAMIERQLGPASGVRTALSPTDIAKIVEKTAGYSGKADIPELTVACRCVERGLL